LIPLTKLLKIMQSKLHYNVVTPLLLSVLNSCMSEKLFEPFRLVGGTALSLQRGHRMSIDIDLFTDAEYQSIDFEAIDNLLRNRYTYVDTNDIMPIGMGKAYFVGENEKNCIKLDLYYTDTYIDKPLIIDDIRLATVKEIIAMKADVVSRGGRKKDFWDLHDLINEYTLNDIIELHKRRYPYTHDAQLLKNKFTDFNLANDDFDPICLYGKHWELIKLDMLGFVNS